MAQLNFDATQVEPDTGFDTVPGGWYNVAMDESDLKPTKDGAGTFLQSRFNILDGQYRGRKLFTRLNIRNANAQAQEIALRQLSAIGHAVGVLHIADSQQLHGLPLKVKVKIRKGDDNYEDQNEIISYKNINEPVETVAGTAAAPAGGAPAMPAGFGTPPAIGAPAAPAGFGAPPPAAPVAHDPLAAAVADGWIKHPDAAGYHYKGQDVKTDDEVAAMYPAPAAAPAAPAAPFAQPPMATLPQADPANPFGGAATQPWNGGAAPEAGAPAPAAGAPTAPDPHPEAAANAAAAPPPWANQGAPAA